MVSFTKERIARGLLSIGAVFLRPLSAAGRASM